MIRWLIYLIVHVSIIVLRFPLAIIAVLFFSSPNKRYLMPTFHWLETIDNDLAGDSGWREAHLIGSDPLSTLNRIRWLWRNGGNAVNYGWLGCAEMPVISITPYRWQNAQGFWLYRRFIPLAFGRQLELFLGWALLGAQRGRCKFVCSIRLSKIKPAS
jgi:hypothetical protein